MARRNPLLTQTEKLLDALLKQAITQLSSRGKKSTEEVVSDPDRMTVAEMRGLLDTSIRWQQVKDKIMPPEEDESVFEGLMNGFGGTAGTGRRQRSDGGDAAGSTLNGATDSEGMDRSH